MVEAGLILVRHEGDAILVLFERFGRLPTANA